MAARIVRSPSGSVRLARAGDWLRALGPAREVVVVSQSLEAAAQLTRALAAGYGATFGWHRVTLPRLAGALAEMDLAARDLAPAGRLSLEALAARTFHALAGRGEAGRFAPIQDRPGLPRALARTIDELRLAGVSSVPQDGDLTRVLRAYDEELASAGLADRACVFELATARARTATPHDLLGKPTLLLDIALASARECDLVAAIAARAETLLATLPSGDERTLGMLRVALGTATVEDADGPAPLIALRRLQSGLFGGAAGPARGDDTVVLFSAPGESRECVEVVRRLRAEAERGVAFDRMAILLRAPQHYATHLEEALRRASVPAYFARGAVRPNPTGRAFLSLLACAGDGLSARRFAEYLSLGAVPDLPDSGQPPAAPAPGDRFVPPDEETLSDAVSRAAQEEDGSQEHEEEDARAFPVSDRSARLLRTPRHWEKILIDAAVIGGRARWARRLQGWRNELELDRKAVRADDEALTNAIDRDIAALDSLGAFALPLLDDLAALGTAAPWGAWIDRLTSLATRALRNPSRVLAVLAELAPMANVGPVDLAEVRLALEGRLSELIVPPTGRPAGKVFVASAEEARGLAFDVVFVPGLAEKLFPQKVQEDPILTDAARAALDARLRTNADRAAGERLALRLAVGAARARLVLSYPRLDLEQSRPRTPSFYALEVLRASVGELPGFDELARVAEGEGGARVGWPAPARSADAIDEAEHDLALLDRVMRVPEDSGVGTAHFLLNANAHLARALRFRGRRWNTKPWKGADGLVDIDPRARDALRAHALSARSYSPTALQHYAACPYRFVLQALHRLQPREEPTSIEELNPLSKGSLVHETLFALYTRLRDDRLLPVTSDNLEQARARLDDVLATVAAHFKEALAPAIDRVWNDEIDRIKADLRELLRRASEDPAWVPTHVELSFGLTDRRDQDPLSTDDPVVLDCGIRLRGSIDLVEQSAATRRFRATDYKTGKVRAKEEAVIAGGKTLQPVMYALAIEKLLHAPVEGGRLYYCTSTGGFTPIPIILDAAAREAANAVASAIGSAIDEGFLPAAPDKGECEFCDYRPVCGPHEERRTKRKDRKRLEPLIALRKRP